MNNLKYIRKTIFLVLSLVFISFFFAEETTASIAVSVTVKITGIQIPARAAIIAYKSNPGDPPIPVYLDANTEFEIWNNTLLDIRTKDAQASSKLSVGGADAASASFSTPVRKDDSMTAVFNYISANGPYNVYIKFLPYCSSTVTFCDAGGNTVVPTPGLQECGLQVSYLFPNSTTWNNAFAPSPACSATISYYTSYADHVYVGNISTGDDNYAYFYLGKIGSNGSFSR
jgi:hypothetical protein